MFMMNIMIATYAQIIRYRLIEQQIERDTVNTKVTARNVKTAHIKVSVPEAKIM